MSGFRFKALVSVYIEAAGSGGGAGRAGTSVFPTRKSRRGVPSGNVAVGEGTNIVNTGRETSGERAARFYFSGRIKFFETRLPDAPDEFISAARCGCGEERADGCHERNKSNEDLLHENSLPVRCPAS